MSFQLTQQLTNGKKRAEASLQIGSIMQKNLMSIYILTLVDGLLVLIALTSQNCLQIPSQGYRIE